MTIGSNMKNIALSKELKQLDKILKNIERLKKIIRKKSLKQSEINIKITYKTFGFLNYNLDYEIIKSLFDKYYFLKLNSANTETFNCYLKNFKEWAENEDLIIKYQRHPGYYHSNSYIKLNILPKEN
jgi:hypothetical protein